MSVTLPVKTTSKLLTRMPGKHMFDAERKRSKNPVFRPERRVLVSTAVIIILLVLILLAVAGHLHL